jgi:hypothetical protein
MNRTATPWLVRALLIPVLLAPAGAFAAQAEPTAAELVRPGAWNELFPFRLGDSWTYDWKTGGRLAGGGTSVRTRGFDGTSFLHDGVGYKLVSDDGTFHLYTFEDGVLAVHSSLEMGRHFDYDPPVILAAPDLRVGQPLVNEQASAGRRWVTTVLGMQEITVPLGTFPRVLAIQLDMSGPDYVSTAVHYFAPRVGLVAYRYARKEAGGDALLLEVDAQLRLARLAGVNVTTVDDVARIAPHTSSINPDRGLRERVRAALDRRYTWGAGFRGFSGEATLREAGRVVAAGRFEVTPDLSVRVEAPDAAARAALRNEISSFVTHRKPVDFDLEYVDAAFVKMADRPDGSLVVVAADDPLMTTYTLKDDAIVETGRSMGRVSYVARERSRLDTGDGRTITTEYDVTYLSNENHATLSTEHTRDAYTRLGDSWVPAGRVVVKQEPGRADATRELALTDLRAP